MSEINTVNVNMEEIITRLQKYKKIIDKETDVFKEEEIKQINRITTESLINEDCRTKIENFAKGKGTNVVFIYCDEESGKVNYTTDISETNGLGIVYNTANDCIDACGYFENGNLSGRGVIYNKNGTILAIGNFVNGVIVDGKGIYRFSNGNYYVGEFVNGIFNGIGKIIDTNGKILKRVYFGNGNFINGKGIICNKNGNILKKDTFKHGEIKTEEKEEKQLLSKEQKEINKVNNVYSNIEQKKNIEQKTLKDTLEQTNKEFENNTEINKTTRSKFLNN